MFSDGHVLRRLVHYVEDNRPTISDLSAQFQAESRKDPLMTKLSQNVDNELYLPATDHYESHGRNVPLLSMEADEMVGDICEMQHTAVQLAVAVGGIPGGDIWRREFLTWGLPVVVAGTDS